MKLHSQDVPHLRAAAQREDRLVPPPTDVSVSVRRASLTRLVRAGVVVDVPVEDEVLGWRRTAQSILGLRITEAGLAALQPPGAEGEQQLEAAAQRTTKRDSVVALMQREGGAGISELIAATDWQAHTVRAAITGLRKSGLVVETTRNETGAVYRIVPALTEAGDG